MESHFPTQHTGQEDDGGTARHLWQRGPDTDQRKRFRPDQEENDDCKGARESDEEEGNCKEGHVKEGGKERGLEMSPARGDRQTFKNEDLVLKVTTNIDPAVWDEARYEAFIDELCGPHEYQKDAIRTVLRYMASGKYANLRALAVENFKYNSELEPRYGSWRGMESHLQLPDQLACSVDMATGTGKSYVLYAVAAILLAAGLVDRVLVLGPSHTIRGGAL